MGLELYLGALPALQLCVNISATTAGNEISTKGHNDAGMVCLETNDVETFIRTSFIKVKHNFLLDSLTPLRKASYSVRVFSCR